MQMQPPNPPRETLHPGTCDIEDMEFRIGKMFIHPVPATWENATIMVHVEPTIPHPQTPDLKEKTLLQNFRYKGIVFPDLRVVQRTGALDAEGYAILACEVLSTAPVTPDQRFVL